MGWSDGFKLEQYRPGLKAMPPALRDLVWDRLEKGVTGHFPREVIADFVKHGGVSHQELLLHMVALAQTLARPTYSKFFVGAVAEGASGAYYLGTNIEWPGFGFSRTVHAEGAAIISAWLGGEDSVKRLAITGMPCGYCRQFIRELGDYGPKSILFSDGQSPLSLSDLLPNSFGPEDLGVQENPFTYRSEATLASDEDATEPLAKKAVEAAQRAYTPYSKSVAGIVLTLKNNSHVIGAPFENAAYNPSIMPLEAAVIKLVMAGFNVADVARVDLATDSGPIDYLRETRLMCGILGLPDPIVWKLA